MFMAFNVGEGMLPVLLPVVTRTELGGDVRTHGLLLSTFALSNLIGSAAVGAVRWRWPLGRSIGVAQTAAGVAFGGLALASGLPSSMLVLALAGLLTSPMTIWAQTIRIRVLPEYLRGRVFGLLRTLVQSTPPIGGATETVVVA
jgi:MFS family permease